MFQNKHPSVLSKLQANKNEKKNLINASLSKTFFYYNI